MDFNIGDKVIYPNHGIGIVEAIINRVFEGETIEFYQLRLQENNSVVNVPVANMYEIGIRPLIKSLDCEKLFKLLASDFATPPSDWKDRFKEFSDKMRTGDIFNIGEILKNLTYLSQFKPLSFREKRMLERARFLVITELAMVANKTQEKVSEIVETALKQACAKHEKSVATSAHSTVEVAAAVVCAVATA